MADTKELIERLEQAKFRLEIASNMHPEHSRPVIENYASAIAELKAKDAEIEELKLALQPFAERAAYHDEAYKKNGDRNLRPPDERYATGSSFTYGELRAAQKANTQRQD